MTVSHYYHVQFSAVFLCLFIFIFSSSPGILGWECLALRFSRNSIVQLFTRFSWRDGCTIWDAKRSIASDAGNVIPRKTDERNHAAVYS